MNISRYRTETPGILHVTHFNNAGSSLMATPVIAAMKEYIDEETMFGGYETAEKYEKGLSAFYDSAAKMLNAKPEEIAFVESATVAWTRVFYAIDFQPGDIVLTCETEYASNYIALLQMKKQKGIKIKVIPNNKKGELDVKALEKMMSPKVKLLSITHMPTSSGIVNPVVEVGKIAKQYDAVYLLDACQSVGQYPIDVKKIKCDFLSATGRKFLRGPRGTGFLYAKKKTMKKIEPYVLDLRSAEWVSRDKYTLRPDAKRFETWEVNLAGKFGLKSAIDYYVEIGPDMVWERVKALAASLRKSLSTINHIKLAEPKGAKSGIVTFVVEGVEQEQFKLLLRAKHINVSVVYDSSALIDMEARGHKQLIRASVHYYNTEEEIQTFCRAVSIMAKGIAQWL